MRKPILIIILGISLFVFLAWYFSNIFFYLVISGILATILRPLVDYIHKAQIYRVNIPRVLSVLASFAAFILIVFLFISVFIPLINEQLGILSSLNYENIISQVSIPINNLEDFIIQNNLYNQPKGTLMTNIKDSIAAFINEGGAINISNLQPGMYIVEVTVKNTRIRQKLLVQR